MNDMNRFFVDVYANDSHENIDCFSCDASCHCECDGGGECDWG